MTVSKSQPMRPAEIDLIDAINGNSEGVESNASKIDSLGTSKADKFTVSAPITYSNDVVGFATHAVNAIDSNGNLTAWREGAGSLTDVAVYSHAEGNVTVASGNSSHAEGNSTEASGYVSHAEGYGTVASHNQSHAEGSGTIASGSRSHAEGEKTTASGSYSHAEGMYTKVSGSYSHAEGNNTNVSGTAAHGEGSGCKATAYTSHAEGYLTNANGYYSHAEGYLTNADGYYSHAEGCNTTASYAGQHVFGMWNVKDASTNANTERGTYVEIVGKGTNTANRSNARTLDWDGNQWTAGDVTCDAVQGNHDNLYSLRSIGAIVASTPSMEYGTSNSVTVQAGSHTVVDITFGSAKTEVPIVFPSIQCATAGVNLIATVQSVSNSQCAICVTNLGTTDVSDVTVDYLAIYGR